MKISTLLVFCLITTFFGMAQTNYFTAQVSASENDAEENKSNGSIDLTSSDLEMCYDEGVLGIGSKNQLVGLRFTSIDIPKNALIDSVFIQFTVKSTDSDPAVLEIFGEHFFNSSAFVDLDNNISSRTKTVNSIFWNVPNWNNEDQSGLDQRTPNLKDIFTAVITQSLWQTGNSVSFIIDGSGRRSAYSYDNEPSKSARLHVYYRLDTSNLSELESSYPDFSVYPNPASDELFIDLTGSTTSENIYVVVTTIEGKTILNKTYPTGVIHNILDDLKGYSGIAFLQMHSPNLRFHKKIVIN